MVSIAGLGLLFGWSQNYMRGVQLTHPAICVAVRANVKHFENR